MIDKFGDKWSLLVLYHLNEHGTLRFNELHREMADCSQRCSPRKTKLLTLCFALMASLTMSAQYVVSDKYNLWFEDTNNDVE